MDRTSGGVLDGVLHHANLHDTNLWERPDPARRVAVTARAAFGARAALGETTLGGRRRAEARPTPLPVNPVVPDAFSDARSNWEEIVRLCCRKHGVPVDDIKKDKRKNLRTVRCFQEIAFRLLNFGRYGDRQMKVVDIARVLNRAHSTVARAARQFQRRRGWRWDE